MNWINIHTTLLRSPEFVGSEPVSRATWLSVLGYCCEQENGGVIKNCKQWKDRQWQQICGVTFDEVSNASLLLFWEGDDLLVWSYPIEKEEEIRSKRDAGKAGGIRSGEARSKHSFKQNRSTASSKTEAESKLPLNGKERKGIGKEVERKDTLRASLGEGFMKFYSLYPKKEAKADALKAWGQVKGDNFIDLIIPALERKKKSVDWTKDGGQFIPLPASWLRARRWEDEGTIIHQPQPKPQGPYIPGLSR